MNHPLQTKIHQVALRLQRLVFGTALARMIGWTLLVAVVLGSADFLLRFQDPGIRLICSLAVLATAIWTGMRYPYQVWRRRLSDLAVAKRLERLYPELQGQMACSLEFLQQEEDDTYAGSASLRRNVIASATAQAEGLDFSRLVNSSVSRRVFAITGVLLLALGLLTTLDARSVWTATVRLTQPLGDREWPRTNRLQWVDPPSVIARGAPFEVELIDENGAIPEEVTIHYRYQSDGDEWFEKETIRAVPSAQSVGEQETPSRSQIVAFKAGVHESFSYRAEGGDDHTMPWQELQVVDPPRVTSAKLTVTPPKYTGLPSYPGDQRIRAISGSHVSIQARSNKPIKAAWLVTDYGKEIPATVSSQGDSFSISREQFTIDHSGVYWFRLEEPSGIENPNPERWNIDQLPDNPPTVSILRPSSDIYATPSATVIVQSQSRDDLAIRSVKLITTIDSNSPSIPEKVERAVVLWNGPPQINASSSRASRETTEPGAQRKDEYSLKLSPLALRAGDTLSILARANDYLGQESDSAPRRISIVSPSDYQTRLAKRQDNLLKRLARVLQWQREAQSHTRSVENDLKQAQLSIRDSLNNLQSAEVRQRQVQQALGHEPEGIPAEIESLLEELSINHLKNPQTASALQRLSASLNRLERETIPPVQNDLTSSLKTLRSVATQELNQEVRLRISSDLGTIVGGQENIALTIEQLLGDFEGWADRRQLLLEVRHLQEQQRQLAESTADLAITEIARSTSEDSPAEEDTQASLVQRQKDTARRYDKFEYQMTKLKERLQQEGGPKGSSVQTALEKSHEMGIGARMREAGKRIEKGQSGVATEIQQQIAQDIQTVADTLSGQREPAARQRLKDLRSAAETLQQLTAQQDGLRDQLSRLHKTNSPDEDSTAREARQDELMRLRRKQESLRKELDDLTQRLLRLEAKRPAEHLQRAVERSSSSSRALEEEDSQSALEEEARVNQELEGATEKLAKSIEQAQANLESLASIKLEEEVQGLLLRQQSLSAETLRLESLRQRNGDWTRSQTASLGDAASQQKAISEDVLRLSKTLRPVPVFELALTEIQKVSSRAASLLEERETGDPTQAAQRSSVKRFQLLLTALSEKNRQGLATQDQKKTEGSPGQGGEQNSRDPSSQLAELRLLKAMQQEINRRTRLLEEELIADQPLTGDLRKQSENLQNEQERLAEITMKLATPPEPTSASDLDTLPDLHEQLKLDDELPPLDLDPLFSEED